MLVIAAFRGSDCYRAPVQLEQVVRQTDQFPFGLHFLQAAQRELPEAALLFDVPDDRFDNRLARPVDRPA